MPLDRSKWKAAPLSTVSETVQQTKQYDTYFGGKGEYAQFWKQRDGITVKRVLPAHEPGDSPYSCSRSGSSSKSPWFCNVYKRTDPDLYGNDTGAFV